MADARGRQHLYMEKLDQEASKFAALHSLFKKLVKGEEAALAGRQKFQRKWEEIADAEAIEDLASAFRAYAEAMSHISAAHYECIEHLKTVIQEGLRNYPIKIKQQKRSLSSRRANEQQGGGQRSQSVSRGNADVGLVDTEAFAQSVDNYERSQVEELKMTLVHLVNTNMHLHAVALQELSLVVPTVNKLSSRTVKLRKSGS